MKDKLLIFDLDGTIADTLFTIRDALNICLSEFGLPTRSYEQVRGDVGNGTRVLLERSVSEELMCDGERFERIFARFGECYAETHDKIDACYEGLYDVIISFYEQGVKLAVLSNKPDAFVKGIIKKLFPEGVFFAAIGQTDMPKKPDPTVPLMLCTQAGVEPCDTFFVGDSEVDIATAENAGFCSVAVSWGFRDSEVLRRCEPQILAHTPQQLYEALEAQIL